MKYSFQFLKYSFQFLFCAAQDLIPEDPPEHPEDWDTIMDDVEKKIMVGVSSATKNTVRMLLHSELVESNLYNKTRFQLTKIYYDNVQDD